MTQTRTRLYLWRTVFLSSVVCLLSSVVSAEQALEPKHAYKPDSRRDPFIPLVSVSGQLLNLEPESNSALRLEGIMFDAQGGSMAIINGELLKAGEAIGDTVVETIESNKVVVIKDNERIELSLRKEE